jgi:cbb3-type cytochrome oxidase subunit 3
MDLEAFYSAAAPVMGVVVFVAFAAIVAWAYWPKHRARFEADGRIPLRDDE